MKYLLIFVLVILYQIRLIGQSENYGLEIKDHDALIEGKLNLQTENKSVLIGDSTGISNPTFGNVSIGFQAGMSDESGANTFIGYKAGKSIDNFSSSNIIIGYKAVMDELAGRENVVIGAGTVIGGGDRNIVIGTLAGPGAFAPTSDFNDNILIGWNAGRFLDNRAEHILAIGSFNNSPLIYGEFDNAKVEINGSLKVQDVLNLTARNTEPLNPEDTD